MPSNLHISCLLAALTLLAPTPLLAQDTELDDPSDLSAPQEEPSLQDPSPEVVTPQPKEEITPAVVTTTVAPEETPTTPATTQDPEPAQTTTTEKAPDVAGPYRSFRGGIIIADNSQSDDPLKQWKLTFGGYIRMMYRSIQDDPNIQFFGRNDGFVYANARPYFAGKLPSGLGFRFQFEAAATLSPDSSVQPYEQQVIRPRDAFISYEPTPALNLQLGQFKPPHNLEELLPTADLLFADRSVGGDGVDAFEGRALPGLALPREIGAQATGQIYFMEQTDDSKHTGPGVAYALAITNGNAASQSFNDNDSLAVHGRASLHWGDIVSIGGAYYFNKTTIINTQDSIDKDLAGLTGDLKLDIAGVKLLASYQQRTDTTDFLSDQNPADEAQTFTVSRAYMAQIGYTIPVVNIQPAYRFAFYDATASYNQIDPQTTDIREVDELTYHTFALNYRPEKYPATVMLNYTITQENNARALRNNYLAMLVQLTW